MLCSSTDANVPVWSKRGWNAPAEVMRLAMPRWLVVVAVALLLGATAAARERSIVINEVAWGGTGDNPTREWIELLNTTEEPISLDGWRLVSSDGNPDVLLQGVLQGLGLLVLERAGDREDPPLPASLSYSGALDDDGETLRLLDPTGGTVDTANGGDLPPSAWPAGACALGAGKRRSMERIDPLKPDMPTNWATFSTGDDPETCNLCGSPGARNSVSYLPPDVDFSMTPTRPIVGEEILFVARLLRDPLNPSSEITWDLGDGTAASGERVSHAYETPGFYRVSVSSDARGSPFARAFEVVPSLPPIVDFSAAHASRNRSPQSLDEIVFRDESSDPHHDLVSWEWAFGDGATAAGEEVTHTYSHGNTFVVALIVTNAAGRSGVQTQSLRIGNRAPEAAFASEPVVPIEKENVTLNARASFDLDGSVTQYEWDLDGDGSVDQIEGHPEIIHQFPVGGDRRVVLHVIDNQGVRSLPRIRVVPVDRPPLAVFQISESQALELSEIDFVDRSYDPDPEDRVVSRKWDFGDGFASDAEAPAHAFFDEGTYAVTLTVCDNRGGCATAESLVSVRNRPPEDRRTDGAPREPIETRTGDPVTFDASMLVDLSPTGRVVRYDWDLDGDGSVDQSTETPHLQTAFPDDGTFAVWVEATDDDGASTRVAWATAKVRNRPPEAVFSWTPSPSEDGTPTTFHDRSRDSDGQVVSWIWHFGDGTSSTDRSPTHAYPDDGRFEVRLTVRDDDGIEASFSRVIQVENAPPIAEFAFSPAVPTGGEPCRFANRSYDPSPGGRIVHVAWDFGDGITCPGKWVSCSNPRSPTHTFDTPGTYTVTLVVIDEEGALARLEREVVVGE